MKIYNKKIIAAFLLAASLLLSGCGKDKSSSSDGAASPSSDTSVITSSGDSSSQVSDSSAEIKDESNPTQSKTESEAESSDLSSSGTAQTSDKTVKTQSKKTSAAKKTKAQKTSAKTGSQKRTTTSARKSAIRNVQTTASAKNSEAVTAKNEFLISVEIECKAAVGSKDLNSSVTLPSNGIILSKTDIKVKSGQSALDATKTACEQMGIPVVCLNGSYVSSIGPIGEKQCGRFSGWTYLVNGKKPAKSSDKYILEENDTLVWSYVTTY